MTVRTYRICETNGRPDLGGGKIILPMEGLPVSERVNIFFRLLQEIESLVGGGCLKPCRLLDLSILRFSTPQTGQPAFTHCLNVAIRF